MVYSADKKPFREALGEVADTGEWRKRGSFKVWRPENLTHLETHLVDLYWMFFVAGWGTGIAQEAKDAKARARVDRRRKSKSNG